MALSADHVESSGEYRKDIVIFFNSCYLTEFMCVARSVKLTIWSLSSKSIFYIRNPKNLKRSVEYNRQVKSLLLSLVLSVNEQNVSLIYGFVFKVTYFRLYLF